MSRTKPLPFSAVNVSVPDVESPPDITEVDRSRIRDNDSGLVGSVLRSLYPGALHSARHRPAGSEWSVPLRTGAGLRPVDGPAIERPVLESIRGRVSDILATDGEEALRSKRFNPRGYAK